MTVPHYISEDRSEMLAAIKLGWYAMDDAGKLNQDRFLVTRNASVEAPQPHMKFRPPYVACHDLS